MAVPKRRKSKSERDHRRAQWMRSCAVPSVNHCPRCQEPKLPHRVCGACGYYKDRTVIDTGNAETQA
jgi:large subunit ribosomal protein L32